MTNRNTEAPQGEGGNNNNNNNNNSNNAVAAAPPLPLPPPSPSPSPQGSNDNPIARGNSKVYKSGPLFLSSKGIGWTSWKKRWFILTRTSLVFYRSDPNAVPQKGAEVNLTLGGIDLNSSGSVVVKEDKKLLTVLFPDGGRDGRAFTLKAETSEDLVEWKAALEEALANAPNAALVMGQNGIFRNDQGNNADASLEQGKDRQPVKSLVVGRPILLALEDIDGTPSFLEKALRFMENHGVRVEGILRQAADVDDVEHRIREYENGKSEFSSDEDAHVIADCIKYILRELPSSPVPASCCNALLEAYRTERSMRITAIRTAICETFPEPNRRLLQRILMMMQTVASHKAVNRMSVSAVAACMAPLLLRPLLAGDCELEHNFDMGGDGSMQLLQAAAAANHAQAICIILLEEYDKLFGEGSVSPEPYTDSEESGTETDELSDDETYDDEDDYTTEGSDADENDGSDHASNATSTEIDETEENDKVLEHSNSRFNIPEVEDAVKSCKSSPRLPKPSGLQEESIKVSQEIPKQNIDCSKVKVADTGGGLLVDDPPETSTVSKSSLKSSNGQTQSARRTAPWGHAPGRKNLSMESIDLALEDEAEIQRLEDAKAELQTRISEEAKENERLQASLENRKNALRDRRLGLQKDVARLQEQLQKEKEIRMALEAGLRMSERQLAVSSTIDGKVKAEIQEISQAEADIINLKEKADDLGLQLNQQREQNSNLQLDVETQQQPNPKNKAKWKDKQKKAEIASTPQNHEKSTRKKHDCRPDKSDSDKDEKEESLFYTSACLLMNQQTDQAPNQNSGGISTNTPPFERGVVKPASTGSRKSSCRSEGSNSTSSALSKLSNRLNFLKERRTQIANEIHNMDKNRGSGLPVQNPERGRGSEARQSPQNTERSQSFEGQSSERNERSDNFHQSVPNFDGQADEGSRPDIHPNLDRGKSESLPPVEKGRSKATPRTNSR